MDGYIKISQAMDLRTIVNPDYSQYKITHQTPVVFIGSCFASEIGRKAESGKIPSLVNPYGNLFNPVSISTALLRMAEGYIYSEDDLFNYKKKYYSLNHYTAFSSENPGELTDKLNAVNSGATDFLKSASFLFITFGTAWLFDLKETGAVVANCRKLPSDLFSRRQAEVKEIVNLWLPVIDVLLSVNPDLKIWLTVSPVRHINDGLHANQLSKARLLLACEELALHPAVTGYFPSYEIFMDDLRDYRFYARDMLHPAETGIDYVWEKFSESFFEAKTMRLWSEAEKITRATQHRITGAKNAAVPFAETMLNKIKILKKEAQFLDFDAENEYFNSIKG